MALGSARHLLGSIGIFLVIDSFSCGFGRVVSTSVRVFLRARSTPASIVCDNPRACAGPHMPRNRPNLTFSVYSKNISQPVQFQRGRLRTQTTPLSRVVATTIDEWRRTSFARFPHLCTHNCDIKHQT